ncbi:hypothetical protein ACFFWC_28210 [Plantactinospora siamensis]|uniref:Uncharacterized protein n=1 Tax=Plantactinospora siamensis TaxID=555372 RepID=A0ABV6NQ41_9ACTN
MADQTPSFDYRLIRKTDDPSSAPVNVLAIAWRLRPIRTVCWGYRNSRWEARPDVATVWLDPDRDDLILWPVDRATAERAALEFATVPLPTEEELAEIGRTAPP